ncbi:MAG: DNA-directed RNA polymerase subunit alpha [Candidatus Wildermuthbacteria bacterium RIFCSPHIGHO2_12_FULL_45_9]|uniref:DNA-directed RNA polymerase subunit alpha n=1 Tax=Candidatus Wildermuthbacteria bacterium RIFCSPHIGHO2_02_FULL_45_25 TaxID=1802450 RepID=A0A1G2QY46_9BACT|nr:MAG: DNA-directed RNA polymerase subunit alpha [Candidatus Wildermuthbacteria bacterium RIFCSPHIGHO2_01_FULL_45_20]OHA65278.1 MAG: DNA-directed RNA polymerase subunit alpha [Candidatus Wildermuthbacteria bacterium RIFCSPHIGHO2_02_FULL_45_25]OHA70618.1 MAG: DNA-directed RNA polymerase subunit alpha [Candidatus Wildermuthbacteria bacterium RIFCSPHIGHO2_12_FULL_45_9]
MISLPKAAKLIEKSENRGVFEIEGLYPGYGVTIGNALRRILLSSLEGAAVTQVKIKGANHEFSTLPGVMEDVISILLNIKQLRFRMYEAEPQTATVQVKGEKTVTGADFEVPSQAELINKDLEIAHLTSKSAALEMEIKIERGIGYVPANAHHREKQAIGMLALDAWYSPIKKVSSKVENMRVGDRTDFQKVTVVIETDGTITPEDAFGQAVTMLVNQFQALKGTTEVNEKEKQEDQGKPTEKKKTRKAKSAKTSKE